MSGKYRLPSGMSEPVRDGSHITSTVSIPTDPEGFFGRQCRQPDCGSYFKIHQSEFAPQKAIGVLACPTCGVQQAWDDLMTDEQRARAMAAARELALEAASRMLGSAFKNAASRPGSAFRYEPGPPRRPNALPTYLEQETVRTFTCPRCGLRSVVYDAILACPYCGPDTPPRAVFDDSIAGARRMLDLLDHVPEEHRAEIKAFGGERTIAERALGAGVAAVAALAERMFESSGKTATDRNPWQSPDRLQVAWLGAFGKDPLADLDAEAVKVIRLGYARRHILEHNAGKADEKYLRESGDTIPLGRQPRYGAEFARSFLDALPPFAERLEGIAGTAQEATTRPS